MPDMFHRPRASGSRWKVWTAFTTLLLATSDYWVTGSDAASIVPRKVLAGGVELRVLPIGDSITFGAGEPFCPVNPSTTKNCNGYRKPLYERLSEYSNKVEFVGKMKAGDFGDIDNEGYRGELISEITNHGKEGIYQAPNIALVHVGTNDVKEEVDLDNAPNRIGKLLDSIFDRNAKAVVFLAKIIPADEIKYGKTARAIPDFNSNIQGIANAYNEDGKHVVVVDMNTALTEEDL